MYIVVLENIYAERRHSIFVINLHTISAVSCARFCALGVHSTTHNTTRSRPIGMHDGGLIQTTRNRTWLG